MENKKVVVKSNVNHIVGITNAEYRVNKTWESKGTTRMIDLDVLRDLIYEPGVEQLFKDGYLIIEDLEVLKELGLEDEDATEARNMIMMNDLQKKNLLQNKPAIEFRGIINDMSYNQAYELANFAIENSIMIDYDKNDMFKKKVGRDVIKSIENLRLAKEE